MKYENITQMNLFKKGKLLISLASLLAVAFGVFNLSPYIQSFSPDDGKQLTPRMISKEGNMDGSSDYLVRPATNSQRTTRRLRTQNQKKKAAPRALATDLPSEMIPLHMIQVGPPRTATTFQYQVVCLSLFLKLEGSQQTYVHPKLGAMDTSGLLERMTCERLDGYHQLSPDSPRVVKTHNPMVVNEYLQEEDNDTPMWVFRTSSQGHVKQYWRPERDEVAKIGYYQGDHDSVQYMQIVEDLKERGHEIIADYVEVFGLDKKMEHELIEYIQFWDPLRICCGRQMSKGWRNVLLPDWSPIKKVNDEQPPHFCSTVDITKLEQSFIKTALYQKLQNGGHGIANMARPSQKDGEMTGTYCEEYNKAVHEEGLGFNDVGVNYTRHGERVEDFK